MKSSLITQNVKDNLTLGLRFLVQICQELGQPYEEFNAQFLRLKRIQEAEENGFDFRQGQDENDGYKAPQQAYQPQAGYYQQSQEEQPNIYSQPPTNRAQGPSGGRQAAQPQEEEGWGNDDLLPD